MCSFSKTCMLDIQLKDNNITKQKIEQFIWDVSSNIGALLVSIPLVIQFPMSSEDIEKCILSMEKERAEHNIAAKRMKELMVSRKSNTTGFSGIGLYESANCSIHVWPEKQFMTFDISNTSDFNYLSVFDILDKHFYICRVNGLLVTRQKKGQTVEILNNLKD